MAFTLLWGLRVVIRSVLVDALPQIPSSTKVAEWLGNCSKRSWDPEPRHSALPPQGPTQPVLRSHPIYSVSTCRPPWILSLWPLQSCVSEKRLSPTIPLSQPTTPPHPDDTVIIPPHLPLFPILRDSPFSLQSSIILPCRNVCGSLLSFKLITDILAWRSMPFMLI